MGAYENYKTRSKLGITTVFPPGRHTDRYTVLSADNGNIMDKPHSTKKLGKDGCRKYHYYIDHDGSTDFLTLIRSEGCNRCYPYKRIEWEEKFNTIHDIDDDKAIEMLDYIVTKLLDADPINEDSKIFDDMGLDGVHVVEGCLQKGDFEYHFYEKDTPLPFYSVDIKEFNSLDFKRVDKRVILYKDEGLPIIAMRFKYKEDAVMLLKTLRKLNNTGEEK